MLRIFGASRRYATGVGRGVGEGWRSGSKLVRTMRSPAGPVTVTCRGPMARMVNGPMRPPSMTAVGLLPGTPVWAANIATRRGPSIKMPVMRGSGMAVDAELATTIGGRRLWLKRGRASSVSTWAAVSASLDCFGAGKAIAETWLVGKAVSIVAAGRGPSSKVMKATRQAPTSASAGARTFKTFSET